MNNHNFKIVGGDTDSIMFCKQDMSPFSKEEQENLVKEINSLLPGYIKFKNDGSFARVIYLKAKNYLMVNDKGKWKIKGSALKSSTLEPILKQLLQEMLEAIVQDQQHLLVDIYEKYIKLVDIITDITPWCTKKTLSPTTFNSTRKNETDIIDAIQGTEYVSGDKVYLFVCTKEIPTGEIYQVGKKRGQPKMKTVRYYKLAEHFDGEYDKPTYRDKLYKTVNRFSTVLDMVQFKEY